MIPKSVQRLSEKIMLKSESLLRVNGDPKRTAPAERIRRQTVSTGRRADIATGKTAHWPLTLVRPTFSAARSADIRASPPSARRRYPFRSTLAGRRASPGPEIVRSHGTSRLRRAHSRGDTLLPGRPSRYLAPAPPRPKVSHCTLTHP